MFVSRFGSGLAIDLAYDPLEEIGLLSHGAGFQVAVHEPRSKVFPEEDGMSISPATATSIGIRQVSDTLQLTMNTDLRCSNSQIMATFSDLVSV